MRRSLSRRHANLYPARSLVGLSTFLLATNGLATGPRLLGVQEECAAYAQYQRNLLVSGEARGAYPQGSEGLVLAAIDGSLESLRAELDSKSNRAAVPDALLLAIDAGQVGSVQLILDNGWDVNQEIPGASTVLRVAVACDQPPIVKLALDFGADPHSRPPQGRNTLIEAVLAESAGSVELLLKAGVDARLPAVPDGRSALDIARAWQGERGSSAAAMIVTLLEEATRDPKDP